MIKTFRHKNLSKLFFEGETKGLSSDLLARIERRLLALNATKVPQDLNLPGFDFHALAGKLKRYTVHVSGNRCITFGWDEGAVDVDLEDYH
jgi:proteic killer suppression protein